MKTCMRWIAVTLAVVLLIPTLSGCVFVSESGGFQGLDAIISFIYDRDTVVVESDHFQVTDKELTAYEFQAAQVYYQQAQTEYLYYQYGLYTDSYGITKQFKTAADYAAYIVSYYRELGYLEEQAFHYAEEYLIFCEGAKAAGFTLAEDDTQVDDYIQQLKDAAESAKMSFSRYIRNEFGLGVSENDIRSAMEKYFLYSNYADKLEKDFFDGMTEEELVAYRDSNMEDFYTTEYVSYQLPDEDMVGLARECHGVTDIKLMICNYLTEIQFDELYTTYVSAGNVVLPDGVTKTSMKNGVKAAVRNMCFGDDVQQNPFSDAIVKEHAGMDDEAYYKAGQAISKMVGTSVQTEIAKIKVADPVAWVDVETKDEEAAKKITDLQKWLFAKDNCAKTGEQWIDSVEKANEADQKIYTHTLYVVVDGMKLDENHKRHVGYVLFTDVEAGMKATAMLEELKRGEINADTFVEIAKKYSTAVNFLYKLNATDSPVAVSEWAFKSERVSGDLAILSDKDDRYVVYFDKELEDSNWEATAREELTTEKMAEWAEEAAETYHVVSDHVHEETMDTTLDAKSEFWTDVGEFFEFLFPFN